MPALARSRSLHPARTCVLYFCQGVVLAWRSILAFGEEQR
jgi:hypothetical protein